MSDSYCEAGSEQTNLLAVVEDGEAQMLLTTLARRHTANHLRPIFNGLLRVEGAL